MFNQPTYNANYAQQGSNATLDDAWRRGGDEARRQQDLAIQQQRRQNEAQMDYNRVIGQDLNALRNASSARIIAEENARQLSTMYGQAANNLSNQAQATQGNLANMSSNLYAAALR